MLAALLALLAAPAGAVAAAPAVENRSYTDRAGERVLQFSIVIDAPAAAVWKAFVDEPTLRAWSTPLAHVDLRTGGEIEQGFDANMQLGGGLTIHHGILALIPERVLVLKNISSPPGTPGAEIYPQLVQTIALEALSPSRTRLTIASAGYKTGPAFDAHWSFFSQHNPEFLKDLKAFCEKRKPRK